MRRIDLKMNEQYKYEIVKKLVDTGGNKLAAERKLNVSRRTLNRYIVGYKEYGKAFFAHGNTGRKPAHSKCEKLKKTIIGLYLNKYYDANFSHFTELLKKNEDVDVSVSFIQDLLTSEDILSPKARRKTKRAMVAKLKKALEGPISKKEAKEIDQRIYDLEHVHPRRPRSAYYGELLQMDASDHVWFGQDRSHLHVAIDVAIDDATGRVVGAHFEKQETLNGYYHVMQQVLSNDGIPMKILTDNRTVFNYLKGGKGTMERDSFTQFSYACHQLGIALETSSIPQVKGRVERLFQTLQSRLVVELRLAGVSTIEGANDFLSLFVKEFNETFGLDQTHIKSVLMMPLQPKKSILILQASQRERLILVTALSSRINTIPWLTQKVKVHTSLPEQRSWSSLLLMVLCLPLLRIRCLQ